MIDIVFKIKADDIVGSNSKVLKEWLDKKFFLNFPGS